MVRAMASVCACSAQLTTLSVPIAITSPTETSQLRTPPVRIGWLGGRGRRFHQPFDGPAVPEPDGLDRHGGEGHPQDLQRKEWLAMGDVEDAGRQGR